MDSGHCLSNRRTGGRCGVARWGCRLRGRRGARFRNSSIEKAKRRGMANPDHAVGGGYRHSGPFCSPASFGVVSAHSGTERFTAPRCVADGPPRREAEAPGGTSQCGRLLQHGGTNGGGMDFLAHRVRRWTMASARQRRAGSALGEPRAGDGWHECSSPPRSGR